MFATLRRVFGRILEVVFELGGHLYDQACDPEHFIVRRNRKELDREDAFRVMRCLNKLYPGYVQRDLSRNMRGCFLHTVSAAVVSIRCAILID